MFALINTTLVLHDHYLPEAALFIEDGKISGFGEMRTTPIPDGCEPLCAIALGYSDFSPAPLPPADDEARILRLG